MAQLWNFKTNQAEEVDDNQVTQLVASGSHGLPKGQPISVVTSYGQQGTLPPEEAVEAFKSGKYRYETLNESVNRIEEREFGSGFANDLKAGTLGFARGLTLGASDQILEKTGVMTSYELAQRKERNPDAIIFGEATGYVILFLFLFIFLKKSKTHRKKIIYGK